MLNMTKVELDLVSDVDNLEKVWELVFLTFQRDVVKLAINI